MSKLYEYDVYLPVVTNDGARVDDALLQRYRRQLVDAFGGLTDFRHRSEGTWKMGGVTFRDEIVLLRVLAEDRDHARQLMSGLQDQLAADLDQHEVLIIEREVSAL